MRKCGGARYSRAVAVTLKDVARRAGVSPRTVSNVVNGHGPIAPATRSRVEDAITDLGYRPNVLARTLRTGRTGIIALAIPELDVPYFAELARFVVEEAEALGYRVMLEQTDGRVAREREQLRSGPAPLFDGLIFSPISLHGSDIHRLAARSPVVLLGERSDDGLCDHVMIDNVGAARDATAHLIASGRRRVAAIGDQPHVTARMRTAGYSAALADAGIAFDPELLVGARRFHRADGATAMRGLLAGGEPPDAVFCFNDLLALGAMRVILGAGLRVPEDIAVVGFDDIEDGQYATPSLTTVAPDKRFIAREAVRRLVARIADPGLAPQEVEAPYELVVRESSGG